ncbi:MAG: PHP domain-containing protein, partial [Moorella sp. (in: Bacteria)]|nr:PHP domain-containing protein [Moorella sp. (in: firmicutes)]
MASREKGPEELFRQGAVHKVVVDRRHGRCWISLCPACVPGAEDIEAYQQFLARKFPGFTFVVNVAAATAPTDLATFCRQEKTAIFDHVARELGNGSAAWLAGARLETRGETLFLVLPVPLAVEALKSCRGDRVLQEVLRHYGYQVKVELVADRDYQEELAAASRQLQARQVEQLRKESQPEIKASSGESRSGGAGPLLGKKITAPLRSIKDIQDEEKQVAVQGEILNYEARQLKSGRWLISFDLTDFTDSISGKAFADGGLLVENGLEKGDWIQVQGTVQYDRYSQELVIIADTISLAERPERRDIAPEKRVELHLHTKMSAMDGVAEVAAVVKQAARWGHGAVAITDHGVLQAFPAAAEAGQKHGVKIIYGLEGYLFDDDGQPPDRQQTYHIILLVKNKQGLANLYRLVSRAHLDFFYRKPRLPRHLLQEYREGLLLGTACEAGELIRHYLAGVNAERLEGIAS